MLCYGKLGCFHCFQKQKFNFWNIIKTFIATLQTYPALHIFLRSFKFSIYSGDVSFGTSQFYLVRCKLTSKFTSKSLIM